MMLENRGEALFIDTQRFLSNKAGLEAVGIAMDLIGHVWWPTKCAFAFDEEAVAAPSRG